MDSFFLWHVPIRMDILSREFLEFSDIWDHVITTYQIIHYILFSVRFTGNVGWQIWGYVVWQSEICQMVLFRLDFVFFKKRKCSESSHYQRLPSLSFFFCLWSHTWQSPCFHSDLPPPPFFTFFLLPPWSFLPRLLFCFSSSDFFLDVDEYHGSLLQFRSFHLSSLEISYVAITSKAIFILGDKPQMSIFITYLFAKFHTQIFSSVD